VIDGFHMLIQNRTMKPLATALSGAVRGSRGRDSVSLLRSVQGILLIQQIYPNKKCF
jgi:hypothetical protein